MATADDAPQIDDRRRFKELRGELLWCRALIVPVEFVGLIAALIFAAVVTDAGTCFNSMMSDLAFLITGTIACAPVLALPTLAAKRGSGPFLLAALAMAAAGVAGTLGCRAVGADPDAWFLMMFGVSAAAAGLVEGIFERSVATTFCGMVGGAAGGVAGPMVCRALMGGTYLDLGIILFVVGALSGNLAIGLSLALGRWMRDLPKKKQRQTEPTQ